MYVTDMRGVLHFVFRTTDHELWQEDLGMYGDVEPFKQLRWNVRACAESEYLPQGSYGYAESLMYD